MNATERRLVGRMYACLNAMTGLSPSNPANTAVISKNLRRADEGARCLMPALEHLIRGEYVDVAEYLDDAERVLGVADGH